MVLFVDDGSSLEFGVAPCLRQLVPKEKLAIPGIEFARDYLLGQGVYVGAPKPTLVLVDLRMRQNAAFQFLRWLHEQRDFQAVRKIALGYSWHEDKMAEAVLLQTKDVILISHDPDRLKSIIKTLVTPHLT